MPLGLYVLTLGLTIVVETALAVFALPRLRRRLLVDVPLASCLTHPLATWAVVSGWPLLPVEAAVVGVEALVFYGVTGLDAKRALLLSLLVNAATTAIGVVWSAL